MYPSTLKICLAQTSLCCHVQQQLQDNPITIHYYHCDHLGTPLALTDQQGQIVWAARYDPWGNIEEEFNPHDIEQNIRLLGQHHDRETGLYYNRHRYYDPKLGSYINQDPIGTLGGANVYAYVRNPMKMVDPVGLASCEFDLATGRLICMPMNPNNSPVDIPAASGNNSAKDAQGKVCRNNSNCTGIANVGSLPLGTWQAISNSGSQTSKPNGRILEPIGKTNQTEGRTSIRSHSCLNPFGPGLGPKFCSEGCLTATASDIQKFNALIDAEPGSTVHVVDSSLGGLGKFDVKEILDICGTDLRCQATFFEYSTKYNEK